MSQHTKAVNYPGDRVFLAMSREDAIALKDVLLLVLNNENGSEDFSDRIWGALNDAEIPNRDVYGIYGDYVARHEDQDDAERLSEEHTPTSQISLSDPAQLVFDFMVEEDDEDDSRDFEDVSYLHLDEHEEERAADQYAVEQEAQEREVAPPPSVPEGYEWTGEFRTPNRGEEYMFLPGWVNTAHSDSHEYGGRSYYILRKVEAKSPSPCGCGGIKPGYSID